MTVSTPFSLDLSIMVLSAGIRLSQPSSPKRFSDDHFLCRNSSNLQKSAHILQSCRKNRKTRVLRTNYPFKHIQCWEMHYNSHTKSNVQCEIDFNLDKRLIMCRIKPTQTFRICKKRFNACIPMCTLAFGLCVCVCVPGGADHASQQSSLLLQAELHDSRPLNFLSDPLTLVQVIDEHELNPYMLAIRHLRNTTFQQPN